MMYDVTTMDNDRGDGDDVAITTSVMILFKLQFYSPTVLPSSVGAKGADKGN